MKELTAQDIQVGKTYRGKRYQENFLGKNNNRTIVWISTDRTRVQYDGDTVKLGMHYPTVDMEKFLKWAKEEVISKDEI